MNDEAIKTQEPKKPERAADISQAMGKSLPPNERPRESHDQLFPDRAPTAAPSATSTTVWAAVIGNFLVAITKIAAALFTGSSAMLAEAFHSFVDTGNEALLLYGLRRSRHHPDADHPFGYGRELYFWCFIVALLLFGLGCVASVVQGVNHIRDPHPVEHPLVIYIVLGLSLLFEGASWLVAVRGFRPSVGREGYLAAIRESKDPPQFVVLLEDTAALIGIAIVFAGTWASIYWDEPRIDGIASIAVGVLLGFVSVLLARESKGLLIGERADMKLQEKVFAIARTTVGVIGANGLASAQLAPGQVVVALSVQFEAHLTTPEIEQIVVEMEEKIRRAQPQVFVLYVKPQSPEAFAATQRRIHGQAFRGSDVDAPSLPDRRQHLKE
jgi:cation diffusion facilitator family transporter